MTFYIIVAIVGISLYAWNNELFMEKCMDIPYLIKHRGEFNRLFLSGLVHANYAHLAFNMITLYFFGPYLESIIGITGLLIVLIVSQLSSGILSLYLHGNDPTYRALGASGAISGLVMTFVVFKPLEPIYLFLIPFGIPSFVYAIAFVAYSTMGISGNFRDGIGHAAHLGGAIGGIILGVLFRIWN